MRTTPLGADDFCHASTDFRNDGEDRNDSENCNDGEDRNDTDSDYRRAGETARQSARITVQNEDFRTDEKTT